MSNARELAELGGSYGTGGFVGMKNRIINGAMMIDQRNAGASVTPANGQYLVDRWSYNASQASKFTAQQNQGSVTPPNGFKNYLGLTVASAVSIGAGDNFTINQRIEGFNVADLGWGTASAQTVTLSFWVRSSLTGTFGGAIVNGGFNRTYPFTYSISAANTWEQKTVTIAGDTTGTWATDNSWGIAAYFSLGAGSTLSGTAGAWSGTAYVSATGATSVVGTSGATFYITGVQLEKGSTATSFDYRPYGTELALCQRYYEKSYPISTPPASVTFDGAAGGDMPSGQYARFRAFFRTTKRTQPSITLYAYNGTSGATTTGSSSTITGAYANMVGEGSFGIVGSPSALASTTEIYTHWTASAEL